MYFFTPRGSGSTSPELLPWPLLCFKPYVLYPSVVPRFLGGHIVKCLLFSL